MTIQPGRLAGLLATGAAPIAVAVAVQSAGNLAFHAVVGRLLDPDSYGALGAVLAAMVMLGVPLGALQTAASALVASHGAGWVAARSTLRSVALWSLIPGIVVLACTPLLRDYFHLGSLAEAAQLGPYLLIAAVTAAARGLLLGDRKIATVATTYFAGTAVRLGLGLALVLPFGVSGALAATVVGELASLALAIRTLRRAEGVAGGSSLRLRAVGHAGLAVTGLFLFSTVDLLLARHHLRDGSSGSYVAAATIAKTVLALPAGIMSAVFPRLLAGWAQPGRGRVLLSGAAAVAGPALLGGLLIVALPAFVLRILYGHSYADATGLVRTLASVAALTSVVTVLTNAALARRSWTIAVPWAGAVFEIVLIEMFHGSANQIAVCSAAALIPIVLLMVLLEGRAWMPAPARTRTAAAAA